MKPIEAIKTTWQEGDAKVRRVLGTSAFLALLGTGFIVTGAIGEISPSGDNKSSDYTGFIVEGSAALAVGVGIGTFVVGTETWLREIEEGPLEDQPDID